MSFAICLKRQSKLTKKPSIQGIKEVSRKELKSTKKDIAMIDLLLFKMFPDILLEKLFNRLEMFDIKAYARKANIQLRHNWFSRVDLDSQYSIILRADMRYRILFISAYKNSMKIWHKSSKWSHNQNLQQFVSDQLFDFKLELKQEVYPHYAFYPPF